MEKIDDSNDDFLMILGSIPGNCCKPDDFFDDSIDDFLMIWGNRSGDDFSKKLREIIKKSSIESSKNHRFWDFPLVFIKHVAK